MHVCTWMIKNDTRRVLFSLKYRVIPWNDGKTMGLVQGMITMVTTTNYDCLHYWSNHCLLMIGTLPSNVSYCYEFNVYVSEAMPWPFSMILIDIDHHKQTYY